MIIWDNGLLFWATTQKAAETNQVALFLFLLLYLLLTIAFHS